MARPLLEPLPEAGPASLVSHSPDRVQDPSRGGPESSVHSAPGGSPSGDSRAPFAFVHVCLLLHASHPTPAMAFWVVWAPQEIHGSFPSGLVHGSTDVSYLGQNRGVQCLHWQLVAHHQSRPPGGQQAMPTDFLSLPLRVLEAEYQGQDLHGCRAAPGLCSPWFS